MADRATIDTMNKVLDNLFGKRSYSKGSVDQIPVGRRQYKDDLAMLSEAGMTEDQFLRLMNFAKVSDTSRQMIRVSDNVKTDQSPIIRNQKEVSNISHAFINEHTRDALVTSNKEVQKYNERAVKDIGYFARIKKLMSNPAKLKQVLGESFNNNQPFSGRPIFDKTFKTLGSQVGMVHSGVAHNLKFIEELNRIGKSFDEHRAKVQANRQRGGSSWESVASMLVGGRSSSPYVAPRSSPSQSSKSSQANLTPISLPSNPAAITQSLAVKFVAEQRRQQAMQQSASLGQTISRSNFLKTLARQNKPSGQASGANLNFLGSRGTHPVNLRDKFMSSSVGRWLGSKSEQVKRIGESVGVGLGAGALSYGAFQLANIGSQAIGAFGSDIARMLIGGYAKGGSVPGYAVGGDPLRNIHLTKSPESASKLIGSNVVNSLQSDANSTGLYGLLQSMIKSGSTDASFRGLFYRKGLDANEWMEKVHQMKLQQASTFMNGYFASGGSIPSYSKGTSDEIPFNFKHFQIGRNSKFIKQMFDLSAPYMNDSDGQYQMFRAIENKKMGPKDFGLLAATLKDMNPVSALSYQSDGSGIEMTDLGTHPKFQKQGFGQVLLAEMLNIGKDKGLDLATWSANSNEAAGYYNYLGATEGANKSFTFDLNEWTGKFAKKRALGGDTFPQQLAQGPNSQLSADAIKRLQLLRIRAQAGQRLAGLRDNAQLNMQLGNTSLFRSPETAAGVMNARVIRNLESIFSGQKLGKFTNGGIPRFDGGGDPSIFHINPDRRLETPIKKAYNDIRFNVPTGLQFGKTKRDLLQNIRNSTSDLKIKDLNKSDFGNKLLYAIVNRKDNFYRDILHDNGKALGAIGYSQIDDSTIEIDSFGVRDSERSKGHGTTLLNNVSSFALKRGIQNLKVLPVDDENTIKFYKRHGFEFIKDDPEYMSKQLFATGGQALNNPIRVSDGELGIPRGMVDKIGLNTLRRINAGDMSALKGFSTGGMFEFDGPGTGTSDSILTDADRGPKGQDASDIGFIIRRTSSDRLKSIVGRAMGGTIPGFIGGGNPFTDLTDFSNRLNARVADPKTGDNIFAMPRRTVVPQINSALAANPSGSATDIYKTILTSEKYLKTIQKNVGFERGTEYTTVLKDVLQDTFGQKIDVAEPVFDGVKKFDQALVAVTDSLNKQNVKLKENLKVIDNKSSDRSYSGTVVGDDAATGTYRGELDYPQMRGSHFGETDVTDFVESGPENPPGRNDILSQGMGPRGTGGIGAWWNRNISGHLARVGKEVFDPTEMQYRVQGNIEMPIGAVGYQTEEQRAQLESNRREYNTYGDDLKGRVREQFGDVLGNLDIDELVKVTQGTKQADRRFATGVNVDKEGNVTADTKPMQVTVGTIQVNATALQSKLQGKMNADEFDARMQRAMRPSAGAMAGVYNNFGFEQFKDGEQIQKATVNVSRFHEEVKKVNMTQTGLYKMGDILRGLSWRFASLGMSAMGVYFSIQGLMMTFQQGIGAITTPLADIEALMKNIGMSTAFGDGIMNASKAMEQLNVGRDDFIDGWKNLTNIQGTIQTLFASIGAKIFGGEKGKEFTDELLSGITDAFDELDKGGITEVVRDLLSSIVEALPAILPAIKTITGMLQEMAKNKALVSMGAQLMMLSLVVQPLASGLAAIVTILGGMFTFGNLFNVFAKGFFATAVASEAAAGGITAMGIALRVLTAATVIGGVILLYEVVANLANALNLLGDFKLPTLTGWALNAMSGGNGYAAGGEIGGTATAAIDDKTINVEEGEFVVKKDVAQRHRRELAQFNKTGVWPGSQKMAGGGFLGPSMGASVSAVESTYQSNKTATLMEDGNRYGYNTQQVLTDVQNGDALNVFVKNMPDSWGNGSGNQQMPFDMGYPYHLNINPTPFSPDFKGFIPNPVVDNPTGITPVWNRDTTGIINPDVNVAPDKNVNPNEQSNPNTQGTNENTTGITPTSSALNYIGQIINQAFDQVVEAFQGAVDGIVGGFFAVMKAAHSAAESIADFAGAIGQSLGNMSAKPLVDFFKGTGDNEGTPTSGGLGFRANSGDWLGGLRKTDYEDLLYNHGGYTKYGDKTNYLADSTKRSGVINQYRKGRILPPGKLPDGYYGPAARMREIWPTKQLIRKDFPYDYGEVGRALTTGDPYQVALAGASATASNAIVGGVGKGLQYGALRMGGTLTGGALARVGAGFSQMNMAGGNPLVFAAAHYLESGQAFDEFMEGRSTEDLKTGEFNAVTGALTGGFSTAGFGKGMEVWKNVFGMKDDAEMRERLKANEGLMNFGIKDVNPLNVLFGDDAWDAGWDKLKGGNRAVSDILESASFKVGDFDIGKGAGDIASAVNKGVFDIIEQALNLDVGTIFGAGTSVIGLGAGAVETAGNTAQMAMENPWSMAQLGITAGVPLIGPFLAAMGMPQTTDWITNAKGYGSQDITPESMGLPSEPLATTSDNFSVITELTTAINSLASQSQQQSQPIIVYLTNQINGEELATKGYVETKIQTEVPKVMSDNKPRIVGH